MRKSTITETYASDIGKVWDMVTDNTNYSWRSDLERIDILDGGGTFIEYTKEGFFTEFTITCKEPCGRYEFTMKNKNFTGRWTGLFSSVESGGTRIEFTEVLYIKNPVMELLSYIAMPLKKIQRTYAADLRRALGEDIP
ncbi:SRPBCC family protein [Breznakiella homolactica]|uniref:SRPBCC family protein n=1 Tax=Breznakiella homolactica TaxID=2798577 RepID=A0A7T8BAZ6_9SPIR|nr:SRPBCC family protein [Breznakiella homolactica]QQO08688.1 SRPBCC family protein [Breznakiella homolactica]